MIKKLTKNQKGFSLIELSIVVLIIGLLIAAVIGGRKLVTLSNLSKARALTNSSPVAGIENLAAWYETTSKNSFLITPIDAATISTWNDINPQKTNKNNLIAGNAPIYTTNAINGLPAIQFNGSSNYLEKLNTSLVTGAQLSVFVVMKRISLPVDNAGYLSLFSNTSTLDWASSDSIGCEDGNSPSFFRLSCIHNGATNDITHPGDNIAILFTTIYDGTNNNSFFNGSASPNNPSSSAGDFNIQNIRVGARQVSGASYFWNGYIGEVIIYERTLSTFERQQIEQYLSKKWAIKLT